ncbi:MAG: response regulator [Chloroflexi bacterium]|nr:response regulator [Chloroflexota bacterium]
MKLWQQWPLALRLTFFITAIIVLVVFFVTALTIRRERESFRLELQQQALLLLQTITASSVDFLYTLDADYLSDLMRDLGRANVVASGSIYDAQGRIIADATNSDLLFNIKPDPFGQQVIQSKEPIFIWRSDHLMAARPVILGSQVIGGVSIGLPTAPLDAKITAVRNQGAAIAVISVLIGLMMALLLSRSITDPLQQMINATERVSEGDLSYRVDIQTGDELSLLGEHFNQMTSRLDQTLQQMEAEIEERRRAEVELQSAKDAAEAANRAKSAFLANMSHELRTPLNAILGFSKLTARKYPTTPEAKKNMDTIYRSGQHLLTLINQILDMSKIEAGRMRLNEQTFAIYPLLEEMEGLFRLRAQEKQLNFIIEIEPDVPAKICADEMKLRQVLINLLGNAFKLTEEGFVRLRIWFDRDTSQEDNAGYNLYFAVQDTGPGIQQDEMALLFEAFTRATAGRASGQGSGLGLALSRQFVQLMGGDISVRNVESEPGHGAIFEFYIRVEPVTAVSPTVPFTSPQIIGLNKEQQEYRILIVDDRQENRRRLVEFLQPLGFLLKEGQNGRESLALWEIWQPDAILMDMQMPEMDGYEATRQINLSDNGQQPVIIAMTPSAFADEREEILAAGCDDLIRKPIRNQELITILQRHLPLDFHYASTTSETDVTLSEDIMRLPPPICQNLKTAVTRADMVMIDQAIQEIQPVNPQLAAALQKLADDFEYDTILTSLKAVEQ